MRTTGWDIAFEPEDDIWITVELSDKYRVTGTVGGRKVDRVGSIGGVHINPPGVPLDLAIVGEYRAVQVALPFETAASIASQDHELDRSAVELEPVIGREDMRLAQVLYKAATSAGDLEEQDLMREVVEHLVDRYSATSRPVRHCRAGITPARLRRVLDLVEARLQDIDVASMAAEAGLSPYHFAREFKRAMGATTWAYVTSRRLARAIDLLGDRNLPLDIVAQRVGFADASHLSHRMRAFMGCSPTQARKHLLI